MRKYKLENIYYKTWVFYRDFCDYYHSHPHFSIKDFADYVGLEYSNVNTRLKYLEKRGLIIRQSIYKPVIIPEKDVEVVDHVRPHIKD